MRLPLTLASALWLSIAGVVAAESTGEEKRIATLLDDWHAAAGAADENRYFGHFAPNAVFLGTDATERWTLEEFRRYAHPHFAKGRAWSFRALPRHVVSSPDG